MRSLRAALIGAAALTVLLQPVAEAASPASGHLQRTQRRLTWSGGPFVASEPNYLAAGCVGGKQDPLCDHFALTIHLGDGAMVEVSVTTRNPNPETGAQPLDGDDYDVFVYAPNGALVAQAANSRGNERVVFRHRRAYTGKAYEVRVAPWFVMPGSKYTGTVRALSLGR